MKCTGCGREFEGNFCPNCGKKAQETCPVCGKVRGQEENFCTNCGHDFDGPPAPAPAAQAGTDGRKENAASTLYRLLRYAPAALFALFALLLFAFFAAPVAVMPGGGMPGERIPSESYGNVYSMMKDFPSLSGSMAALIVFAVLSLLLAGAMIVQYALPVCRERSLTAFGKTVPAEALLDGAAYLFFFLFFLIGCIVCGQIGTEDGGMGLAVAGACPVLLIVFSLLFLLLAAGAPAARRLLRRKVPAAARASQQEQEARAKLQEERAQEKARKEAEYAAYCAAHPAPVAPEAIAKPVRPRPGAEIRTVKKYFRFKRWMAAIFWLPILYGVPCFILLMTLNNMHDPSLPYAVRDALSFGIPAAVTVLTEAAILLGGLRRLKHFPEEKIGKHGGMTAVGTLHFVCAAVCLALFFAGSLFWNMGPLSPILLVFALYFAAMALITLIGTARRRKKVLLLFYGTAKPEKGAKPLITCEQLLAPMREYAAKKQEYKAYVRRNAAYIWQKKRHRAGKEYEPVPKAAVAVRVYRTPICIGAVLLALVLIAVIVVCSVLNSIFRIPNVAKVNVGDTPGQVLAILGEPYGYDTRSQEGSTFSARTWKYYSANYQKLLKRSENADMENFGDLSSAVDLEEQLENTAYDYIEVNFTGSDDALTVISVFFEPGRIGSGGTEKTVETYEVLSAGIVRYAEYATVIYTVTYTDGSYYKAQVSAPLAEEITDWAATSAKVRWFDRYSNAFSERAHIV